MSLAIRKVSLAAVTSPGMTRHCASHSSHLFLWFHIQLRGWPQIIADFANHTAFARELAKTWTREVCLECSTSHGGLAGFIPHTFSIVSLSTTFSLPPRAGGPLVARPCGLDDYAVYAYTHYRSLLQSPCSARAEVFCRLSTSAGGGAVSALIVWHFDDTAGRQRAAAEHLFSAIRRNSCWYETVSLGSREIALTVCVYVVHVMYIATTSEREYDWVKLLSCRCRYLVASLKCYVTSNFFSLKHFSERKGVKMVELLVR